MKSLGPKTFVYPTPVFVVATYDRGGRPNAMTAAWGGICCSDPPCLAVSLRRTRYTFQNILDQRCFTVNVPSADHARAVDYLGMVSGKGLDKFAETGLTPVRSDLIEAPYIKEFPFFLECRLFKTLELGVHIQIIGEILDVKVRDDLDREEYPSVEEVRPMFYAPGVEGYYGAGEFLGRAFSLGRR